LLGFGEEGWKKALLWLLLASGKVESNQTSGRLRGLASWRVVRGFAAERVGVGLHAVDDAVVAPPLEKRHLMRPTVEGFRA
jgi:hypothetical protein